MTTRIEVSPYIANREPNSVLWHVREDDNPVATILVREWEALEGVCTLVVALSPPFPHTTTTHVLGYPPEYAIERLLHNWFLYLFDEHRLRLETVARELGYSEQSIARCRNDNPRVHCLDLMDLLSGERKQSAELGYSRIRRAIESHKS